MPPFRSWHYKICDFGSKIARLRDLGDARESAENDVLHEITKSTNWLPTAGGFKLTTDDGAS